jgi:hypothetical protein
VATAVVQAAAKGSARLAAKRPLLADAIRPLVLVPIRQRLRLRTSYCLACHKRAIRRKFADRPQCRYRPALPKANVLTCWRQGTYRYGWYRRIELAAITAGHYNPPQFTSNRAAGEAGMHTVEMLQRLMETAERAGYTVRQEWLGGAGGGACEFAGRKWIFIDLALSVVEQLDQVSAALKDDPAVHLLAVPQPMQRYLGSRRAA